MSIDNSKVTLHNNEDINPCIAESDQSFQCLARGGYDKDKCGAAFHNFNECKKFWAAVKLKRRQNGLEPCMPGLFERKQIIEYLGNNLPYTPHSAKAATADC